SRPAEKMTLSSAILLRPFNHWRHLQTSRYRYRSRLVRSARDSFARHELRLWRNEAHGGPYEVRLALRHGMRQQREGAAGKMTRKHLRCRLPLTGTPRPQQPGTVLIRGRPG